MTKLPQPLKPELLARISSARFLELISLDDPSKRAFYENELLKGSRFRLSPGRAGPNRKS